MQGVIELGEALLMDGSLLAANVQVLYTMQDGNTSKLFVSKTRWDDLKNATHVRVIQM